MKNAEELNLKLINKFKYGKLLIVNFIPEFKEILILNNQKEK